SGSAGEPDTPSIGKARSTAMRNGISLTLALIGVLLTPEAPGQFGRSTGTPAEARRGDPGGGMRSPDSIGKRPVTAPRPLRHPPPPGARAVTPSGVQVDLLADCRLLRHLPSRGRKLIVLAPVDGEMHVRVFDRDGRKVLDAGESELGIKPI